MKYHIEELEKRKRKGKRAYLKETLAKLDIPYHIHRFRSGFLRGENIIIDYPFANKEAAGTKRIFLTAHYDTVFWAPGANDNASGVAVLLEFLRRLQIQNPGSVPLRIIFFDLEDTPPGLKMLGSHSYIKKFGVDEIDCLYNLEMVGMGEILCFWPSTPEVIASGWLAPLANTARENGFSLYSIADSIIHLFSLKIMKGLHFISDHASFNKQGCKNACSLTVFPQGDMEFIDLLEKRQGVKLALMFLRYHITKQGHFPKILKHYHCKNDRSEYVEEAALEKILNVLWRTIVGGKKETREQENS